MKENKDKLVKELLAVVEEKKKAIARGEKPEWLTNCVYYFEGKQVNIKTITDRKRIIELMQDLVTKKESFNKVLEILNIVEDFEYNNYTFSQWVNDFKNRLNQIDLSENKKSLDNLEKRLSGMISKELREEMELEAIKKELGI